MKFWKTDRGALTLLLSVSAVLLLLGLGGRELWGPEARWADIALRMLQTRDYFDPYLLGAPYYDKPLPSYWLITATASLMGCLNHWSLRLPSVMAAWLSVWLIYQLGVRLYNPRTGLLAGWLLATTFYFVFWARIATADALTVCGMLAAIVWYWRGPDDTRLGRYTVFFGLLAVTSLFKGLIGFILPGLMLLPHLLREGRWKRHLNLRLVLALLIAGLIYSVPFLLSHLYGEPDYGQSGLGQVFRENVVRFFKPFDNIGPIYTYLIYLPVYTLPWAPCWLIGLWLALRNWRQVEPNTRWLISGLGLMFLFFTASGSRRSYYVLPLVPFAQLLAAWWINRYMTERQQAGKASGRGWRWGIGSAAAALLLVLGVAYPWSNGGGGVIRFAADVRSDAGKIAPWDQWRLVMVDIDNKLPLYLQSRAGPLYFVAAGEDFPRDGDSAAFIAWLNRTSGQRWNPQRTIVVAHYDDQAQLPLAYLGSDHQVILTQPTHGERLFHSHGDGSVAFIPRTPATPVILQTLGQGN